MTFIAKYTGPLYDLKTDKLQVSIHAGKGEGRMITHYSKVDEDRRWSPPPQGTLEVEEIEDVDSRRINLKVKYSLMADDGTILGRDYSLVVEAWKNRRKGPLPDFQGEIAIERTNNLNDLQSVTVPLEYNGIFPYTETSLLKLKMLVDGRPVIMEGEGEDEGNTFCLDYPYEKEWYTDPNGEISDLQITWISPREIALRVDYNYPNDPDMLLAPSIKLYRENADGEEEDVTNGFEIDISPGIIVVPEGGKSGSLAARIWYKDEFIETFSTDEIEIQLKAVCIPNLGHTMLIRRFTKVLEWQHLEDDHYQDVYGAENLQIERPNDYTIHASIDFHLPRCGGNIFIKPIAWLANVPLLSIDESSEAPSKVEDAKELGFEYQEASFLSGSNGRMGLDITYAFPVGEFQVNAISFLFYTGEGDPVYSRTFSVLDAAQGHILAPDVVAPEAMGEAKCMFATQFMETAGEMWAMVTYAKNSDIEGMEIWPEPINGGANPFYPLKLVSERSIPVEQGLSADANSPVKTGLSLAIFRFRLDGELSQPQIWIPDEYSFGILEDFSMTFSMGVPGQEPVDQWTSPPQDINWKQHADFSEFSSAATFPDRLEIYDLHCNIPDDCLTSHDCEYISPFFISAIALKQGIPVPGLMVRPMRVGHGQSIVSSEKPLVLQYDYSDAEEDAVSCDEIVLTLLDTEEKGATLIYRESFPFEHTWRRPPDWVKVVEIIEDPNNPMEVSLGIKVDYYYDANSVERVTAGVLDPDGKTCQAHMELRAEALFFGQPVPAISLETGHLWMSTVIDEGYGDMTLNLGMEGDDAHAVTNQIAVYMQSFINTAYGRVLVDGFARTIVDFKTGWVNRNSLIVATLEEVTIKDDGDPGGPGEDMISTFGVSGEVSLNDRWPIEVPDARWCEVNGTESAPETLNTQFPFFTQYEYNMGFASGFVVGVVDDDSIPAWIGPFISVLCTVGELVATAFGQSYISSALALIDNFTSKLLKQGAIPDVIEMSGVLLKADKGWGVSLTPDEISREFSFKKGGKIMPKIRVERIILPPEPRPITVKLKQIVVEENGDGYNGEVFVHTRVFDGLSQANNDTVTHLLYGATGMSHEHRFPMTTIYYSMEDGHSWTLGSPDNIIFSTEEVGPYLYIEVDAWDEDDPTAGDDHDMLGIVTWKFNIHTDENWQPGTFEATGRGHDEGRIKVIIEVIEEFIDGEHHFYH